LKVLLWNVRGINAAKKQQYLDWLIKEQKPDVVMFNETKLTSPLYLNGFTSHQTLLKRSGGCITFSNLKGHKKVKALGTYLNWTKIQLGGEEVHVLNVYLEPGNESFVVKRADTVVNLAKDIIRQDQAAKIIVGGDLNGQFNRLNTHLLVAGFTPALRQGTQTHRDGNQLDQLWTRNVDILNAVIAEPIDQVSDHFLIEVSLEATLIERGQIQQHVVDEIDPRTLPQTTIRKVMKECLDKGVFEETPDISRHPLVSFVPWDIAKHHTPKLKQGHQTVRYSPAQKPHETPELLQLAGELQNHKVLDALQKHFRAGDMKAFYATAEKVLQIQCGNPVVRAVIKEDQLISEKDSVE